MRISVGIAWLVIVAAEMLVGGTGIGYWVWTEWNNLSLTNVIVAILIIGVMGMMLDQRSAGGDGGGSWPEVDREGCVPTGSSRSRAIGRRTYPGHVVFRRRHAPPCSRTSGSRWKRRVRLHHRPFRLRQDDGAQHPQRARRAEDGAVIVDGRAIEGPSLDRAVIFQGHSLLPWRTVLGNVAYAVPPEPRLAEGEGDGPRQAFIEKVGLKARAQEALRAVGRHEAARRHRPRALDRRRR